MSAEHQGIVGRAIFGTAQGLVFWGNGVLALGRDRGGLFEFDLGNTREGRASLSALGEDGFSMFRRRVAESSERQYDLLGFLKVCRDRMSRAGFAGACVAVPADKAGGISSITAWENVFEEVLELMEIVAACIDKDTRIFVFPNRSPLERTEQDQRIPLRLASTATNVLIWDIDNEDDRPRYFERFRAVCFKAGEQVPTIICTTTQISNTRLISDESFDVMVSEFRDIRDRSEASPVEPHRHDADLTLESIQRTINDSGVQAVGPGAALLQQNAASLSERVTKLEANYQSLAREVHRLQHHTKRAGPMEDPIGWFSELAGGSRLLSKFVLCVGYILLLFVLVVAMLWFLQPH